MNEYSQIDSLPSSVTNDTSLYSFVLGQERLGLLYFSFGLRPASFIVLHSRVVYM
ncbi:hypothetical protein L207DRAFT_516606 [Hyaloscypha variabilis F]|uniref:Uncharacterized protein n=1 Tax=Hyaloscypha variabilis (strain UAMH 11265 / GT02V1 / F) TaxID=1149755 RepID=A0A2J6RAW4_HYAVF|nr:hypothetical protein L207DRAFT_516606 [Hyaloscypha variabilis F]